MSQSGSLYSWEQTAKVRSCHLTRHENDGSFNCRLSGISIGSLARNHCAVVDTYQISHAAVMIKNMSLDRRTSSQGSLRRKKNQRKQVVYINLFGLLSQDWGDLMIKQGYSDALFQPVEVI